MGVSEFRFHKNVLRYFFFFGGGGGGGASPPAPTITHAFADSILWDLQKP